METGAGGGGHPGGDDHGRLDRTDDGPDDAGDGDDNDSTSSSGDCNDMTCKHGGPSKSASAPAKDNEAAAAAGAARTLS